MLTTSKSLSNPQGSCCFILLDSSASNGCCNVMQLSGMFICTACT